MGLRIQRERIRESIQRVDPTGIEGRVRRALHRRVYSVASPNALWHLDGYHKLIRWRIVVHGGIDGYSRLVTYLKASNNNCASTAFAAFQRGILSMDFHLGSEQTGGEKMWRLHAICYSIQPGVQDEVV